MAATLVENSLSRYGLHLVHLVQAGAAIDARAYLELVPEYGRETLEMRRRHEADLDVHHLYLLWNARELVTLKAAGRDVRAVMWWIGRDEKKRHVSLREAANRAAMCYFEQVGEWPKYAGVRELPEGAAARIQINGSEESMALWAISWAPAGYVIVSEEAI